MQMFSIPRNFRVKKNMDSRYRNPAIEASVQNFGDVIRNAFGNLLVALVLISQEYTVKGVQWQWLHPLRSSQNTFHNDLPNKRATAVQPWLSRLLYQNDVWYAASGEVYFNSIIFIVRTNAAPPLSGDVCKR